MKMKKKILLIMFCLISCFLIACKSSDENISESETVEAFKEFTSMRGYVENLCDYQNMNIELAGYEYSEEDLQNALDECLVSVNCEKTFEELTDEDVVTYFSDYSLETKDDFSNYIENELSSLANDYERQNICSQIEIFLLDNSDVVIEEEYIDKRFDHFLTSLEDEYVSENETLDEYISNELGVTVDEAKSTWRELLESEAKMDIILNEIFEQECLSIDEEEYRNYIEFLLSDSYSGYTEEELYEYLGGDVETGKLLTRSQYVNCLVVDHLLKLTGYSEYGSLLQEEL